MEKKCPTCRQILSVTEFEFKDKQKTRRSSWCKTCTRAYKKRYYNANKQKYLHGATVSNHKRRYAIRKELLDYLLLHPCIDCGEADPIVLEFDHRDPFEKVWNISKMVSNMKPMDLIYSEVQKCDVRCANCHRRKTAKQFGWYEHPDDVERIPTRKYRQEKRELENDDNDSDSPK